MSLFSLSRQISGCRRIRFTTRPIGVPTGLFFLGRGRFHSTWFTTTLRCAPRLSVGLRLKLFWVQIKVLFT
ncbi:hypothetical protein Dda3937_04554 [Dickeya dadantii 3937]|uniref:Uncharacterized protein n=1 Tax=Dickeya dadantii (strain 3937) TaxID=198628 RepID=E0SM16_DICD3|nr:hypothetical protein Dda3937_04554 [Dickeya dadantii 3937]